MIADLQSVAAALLDSIRDKNLALAHQKSANRLRILVILEYK